MIQALSARDPVAMRDVLLAHLRNKRDVVLEQLRESVAAQAAGSRA